MQSLDKIITLSPGDIDILLISLAATVRRFEFNPDLQRRGNALAARLKTLQTDDAAWADAKEDKR